MRAAPLVALLLLGAGCLLSPEGVVHPNGPKEPWLSTDGALWIALTNGCGFCSGNPDVAEVETTVLFMDGSVAWFHYGAGAASGRNVTAAPGAEPYLPLARAVLPKLDTYYTQRDTKIHEVSTAKVPSKQWKLMRQQLEDAAAGAKDPGPPNMNCSDCSGTYMDVFSPNLLHATLAKRDPGFPKNGNYNAGDPWDYLVSQTGAVHDWLEPATSPTTHARA